MNRSISVVLILIWTLIGLACAGVVAYFIFGGSFSRGFSFSGTSINWALTEQSRKSFAENDIDEINIQCTTADIVVGCSDTDEFLVVVKASESAAETAAKASLKNGVLDITQPEAAGFWGFTNYSQRVEIFIPSGWAKDVSCSVTTGDITFSDDFTFASADFTGTTGDFSAGALCADTFSLRGTTGDVNINSLTAEEPSISRTTGDIRIETLSGGGEIGVMTGDIHIGLISLPGPLSVSATTGDITVSLTETVGLNLKADTSVGDIRSDFALMYNNSSVVGDSASGKIGAFAQYDLTLKTTTGDIAINAG